ncbi:chemotaxis protein CheB [Myxosarcina sp. GI1]|uniref:chemotaxis protein CheB n=1 Tax=Myxosarcina sp. GI1 TaxID=1541065 RepID=UPI000565ACFC|nr:chemotaxis protein CheB [Myxosarcina sp. GI1]
MSEYKIIVVGASAGGVETLKQLVGGLPADLPAAIFVVLHLSPYGNSALPEILNRAGLLKAIRPEDGEAIQSGRIYVAPPNRHLLVESGFVRLSYGPKENGTRPAIDPLFRTAARAYSTSVIGVLLSGTLDNGTFGLLAIKKCGGIAIVQDPNDALYDSMPRNAIENVEVDRILPIAEIPTALISLAQQSLADKSASISESIEYDSEIAELDKKAMNSERRPGQPSEFTCPDCGGVLWEKKGERLLHFRCRTGHAYSEKSLKARESEKLEEALWAAYRSLLENVSLYKRMASRAEHLNRDRLRIEHYQELAQKAEQNAELIRQMLADGLNGVEE